MDQCRPECDFSDLFILGNRTAEGNLFDCDLLVCKRCFTLKEICRTQELDRWGSTHSQKNVVDYEYAKSRYSITADYVEWALRNPSEHNAKLNQLLRAKPA